MTIQVYGGRDTRAIRVYWMLEELEVPYESIPIDFSAGEHRSADFLALNPAGKVPALKHGNTTLFESAAILTYLAEQFPEKGLIPQPGSTQRAHFFQWMFFAMAELEQPLWTNAKHKFVLPKKLRIPEMKEVASYEWKKACTVVAQALKNQHYLINNQFSAADIMIGQTLLWGRMTGFESGYPALDEYMNRLKTREALGRARG